MIVRPAAERPRIFALALLDRQIVDAGDPPPHQAVVGEFPILVAVAAEPVARIVAPFIGEAYRDAFAVEGPDLLDRPIIELLVPFARQEGLNGRTALNKF
jgi:hypothetical protein